MSATPASIVRLMSNGYEKRAKREAARYSVYRLLEAGIKWGWKLDKALTVARYLKDDYTKNGATLTEYMLELNRKAG